LNTSLRIKAGLRVIGKYFSRSSWQLDGNRQTFNKACTDIIEEKRPILDSHRGWSEFLTNLAIAISTLGIGLLIKGAINVAHNRSFFFVHKTETGKIIDEIQNELELSPCSRDH